MAKVAHRLGIMSPKGSHGQSGSLAKTSFLQPKQSVTMYFLFLFRGYFQAEKAQSSKWLASKHSSKLKVSLQAWVGWARVF